MKANKTVSYSYTDNNIIAINQFINEANSPTVKKLIGIFEGKIRDMVIYDSFEYENSKQAIHIFFGTEKSHKCHYKISLAEIELGEITLTRKKPFEEKEIHLVENALGALTLHLNEQSAGSK